MIDVLISSELSKRSSTRFEVKDEVMEGPGLITLQPNQFAAVYEFQATSPDLAFSVQLASDDRVVSYTPNNTAPVPDPYAARYIANSPRRTIHTGSLEAITTSNLDTFFVRYYLVTCLDV